MSSGLFVIKKITVLYCMLNLKNYDLLFNIKGCITLTRLTLTPYGMCQNR